MNVIWSFQAEQDLVDIGEYIANDNVSAALGMLERITERVEKGAEAPFTGRIVPEFSRSEIREFILGNYRIVYRISDGEKGELAVLTVFEGHRLFPPEVAEEIEGSGEG
jgi:toxin ParE1/3/4